MRLLVSVRSGDEVDDALAGGADIIDVKEPVRGALGAPDVSVVEAVAARVRGRVPLSVALGDPSTVTNAVAAALRLRPSVESGESVLKLGFARVPTDGLVVELLAAVIAEARPTAVVAVAYADSRRAGSPPPVGLIRSAARAGATGLLLDTFAKDGRDLFDHMPVEAVRGWVDRTRAAGLLTAIAGSLGRRSLTLLDRIRPDVVGVRGAACDGGRLGRVSEARVRALRAALDRVTSTASATAKRQKPAPLTPS